MSAAKSRKIHNHKNHSKGILFEAERFTRRGASFFALLDQLYGYHTAQHAEQKIRQQCAEYIEEILKHTLVTTPLGDVKNRMPADRAFYT